MRRGAVFAALLTGLALAMCPVDKSPGNSTYEAAVDSIVAKGVFTPEEADGIGSSAIAACCPDHNDSLYD